MEQEKLLWELQSLILEGNKRRKMEEIKPLYLELKQLRETIKSGEEDALALEEQSAALEKNAQNLEAQANQLQEQAKGGREKLYGVKGGSLKELLTLQQSLLKMEAEAENKEKLYFEHLKRAEEVKAEAQKTRETIKALKKEYNKILKTYREQKEKIELEVAELELAQEEIKERLKPETLKLFLEIEKRYPNGPVALLKGGTCSGCHIGISSYSAMKIKEGKNLCQCDNCGRIIISL